MDKENGESSEGGNSSSKVSNPPDSSALLDAARLFGAYWPRSDASTPSAASLFAAAAGGTYGMPGSLPFGLLPPSSGHSVPGYPPSSSAAAYNNTLSVAASQAASLGIPTASAAWWSMASHLAAQDYLARLQASGLNFPSLTNPGDLSYSALGLPQLPSHHKSTKNSSKSSQNRSSGSGSGKGKTSAAALSIQSGTKLDGRLDTPLKSSSPMQYSKSMSKSQQHHSSQSKNSSSAGLSIQHSSARHNNSNSANSHNKYNKSSLDKSDYNYLKHHQPSTKSSSSSVSGGGSVGARESPSSANSIFTSPLSLVSNSDSRSHAATHTTQSLVNSGIASGLPSSILSDPSSILGGVRLPPDTEIIKYTSSIVGPKIPGTTNRGRKKTISLDPPSVSLLHPSDSSMEIFVDDRSPKRPKLEDPQDLSKPTSDRVEVIKLPATNGSLNVPNFGSDPSADAPLNLSLKPATSSASNHSSSLNSLSNMSANIGADRISRRKPGPKPRKVVQSPSNLPPGAPSASLIQLFATADSPRPPSHSDDSESGGITTTPTMPTHNHKEGRPRNLGRGVSKPKKNTVASLLAQSRALGIKPMPILDPNAPMNQQMSILKSNILAAQQYIAESGGDEKHLDKLRGALSDSSNVEQSTDSDNLTDSYHTDSEMEQDSLGAPNAKKRKQFDEKDLRVPLEKGWKRETIIRGLTKNGGIKGDVSYIAPDSNNKFKQMSDITQYLDYQKSIDLTKENFTFSCRVILGDYLQPAPSGISVDGEFLRLSEEDVKRRLEELRSVTRTNLAVEQRIEVARRQQAARAAARLDREQARLAREIEKSERQEAARRDREARSQQLMEGRKRLAFTLEQKIQIISEIEGGKTKSDVSRELGLASSTVATIWKNRDNILSAYGNESENDTHSKHKNIFPSSLLNIDTTTLTCSDSNTMARRKRQEEMEKHKQEEQQRKQQERELKRQQAAILKEQMYIQEISKQREMLYTVELERERRRQHMSLVKALESRRKLEERERKKQQMLLEKQASKERRMEQRRMELEILTELRKPCEDLELSQKALPTYNRIPGLKLSGQAFSDTLMVFEFLHNFGETLGFDMESLPTLDSLQQALLCSENSLEAEEELLSVMTHLLVCAIEDPGIPNPARHTTILGQSLRQADITHANLSEILRIYLYANATGEVKALTGVHFERDREKRIADHHQNSCEMQQTQTGKNATYYELLHGNATWQMSDKLKDKPFLALSPTDKAAILAFLCNELLQNKAVIRQIEGSLETVAHLKKERWLLDTKIRKLRMIHSRKVRTEAAEKAQAKTDGESELAIDSPSLHKDDLLDEDEDMSENESVGTQPEEEEDNKLSGEELGKKLEKLLKTSETQLHSLNHSAHQLRATCYGQDRYWRRYWSLPTAGGIFIEAMESAQPEVLDEQKEADNNSTLGINSIDDIKRIIHENDNINDASADKEVSKIVENAENESDANEHRKTPKRIVENGETQNGNLEEEKMDIEEKTEEKVDEVVKENSIKEEKDIKVENADGEENSSKSVEKSSVTNLHLFERLGECMENENGNGESNIKTEVKPEVKEELKNEILNELKADIKNEFKKEETADDEKSIDGETKWFSLLSKEGLTCEGVHLTAGNRWDNGIGACSRENMTELKIPVFPPPNCQNNYMSLNCDSPGPLQMTPEESVQLEYIKLHGLPKPCERKIVPHEMRYGWWRITDTDQLKTVLDNLHLRGARERELKRTFQQTMQSMYERAGNLQIEEGKKEATELNLYNCNAVMMDCGAPEPDAPNTWNPKVAQRVDMFLMEQVEALEDKVANASMQVKGWKVPSRDGHEIEPTQAVEIARERLASLEAAIERRYLKPPLGVSTGDPNLAAIAQEASGGTAPVVPIPAPDEIPKGLTVWRDAVSRSATSAQLAMCLYTLEASIAWDKSIMKANCQFCHSGDNEDKLLLCDGCDKGYHTYCFRPKMENIPDGDWYCHECMNKATGERNCIVCGKKQSTSKLVLCDMCPRAYHQECLQPPLTKVPRGKWYCPTCHAKQPKKKAAARKSHPKPARDSESSDHPPVSPAPSHSSVTTNEDSTTQLSTISNCQPTVTAEFPAASPNPIQVTNALNTSATLSQSSTSSSSSSSVVATTGITSTGVTSPVAAPPPPPKKDKVPKKLIKELAPCKALLEDLECHDDAWPFLLPVNTKQFPTYKKIIKSPMDLSTIKKRLQDLHYKSREDFCADVRQIFNNCETFNEDDSPVGKAGHCMRQFFEARWNELCPPSTKS